MGKTLELQTKVATKMFILPYVVPMIQPKFKVPSLEHDTVGIRITD